MERDSAGGAAAKRPKVEAYSWYALSVLVLVYVLNFIDRQLLTILAVDIKRDLAITDSQYGFLYGTAFGVFYALFGIPLGKLADRWSRVKLLSLGLAGWSMMTALSGLSRNFTQLGLARMGVGVGEASAGPSAYSLISDLFPPHRRATAIAIYSAGIYVGGACSLFIGSAIAEAWNSAFVNGQAPFGLAGWQIAFLAMGLPGVLLALWVRGLREPERGRFDPPLSAEPDHTAPWKTFVSDLATIVPPFTLWGAMRRGNGALATNLGNAVAIAVIALVLDAVLGDPIQWLALGIAAYALISWGSALRHDNPAAYAAICGSKAVWGLNVGYGLVSFVGYVNAGFGPLFAMQVLHAPPQDVALIVGGSAGFGGILGVIAGGALADRFGGEALHSRRVQVVAGAMILSVIPYAILFNTTSLTLFYGMVFPVWFFFSAALGASSGTIVNIVPAQVRGTATGAFMMGSTVVGLALGPYVAGRISTETGSLRVGMLAVLVVMPMALAALAVAWRDLRRGEATIKAD
jgi:MFS family permease